MSSRQHFPLGNRADGARFLADNERHLGKGAFTPLAAKGTEECDRRQLVRLSPSNRREPGSSSDQAQTGVPTTTRS